MPALDLYQRLLGDSWLEVHENVRRTHTMERAIEAAGYFRVARGSNLLASLTAKILRMPTATQNGRVRLRIERLRGGERWLRTFDGKSFTTTQEEGQRGVLVEQWGVLQFRFRLCVEGGAILFRQESCALRAGQLICFLPRWLAPQVVAREEPSLDTHQSFVSVSIRAPVIGLILQYEGGLNLEG